MGSESNLQSKQARPQGRSRSRWILSPLADSLLFIGAPLLCIAVFVPMRSYFSSLQIAVFLLAFFTFGHHLPGFLRAYGDKELFERFKWRFLLAPPAFFLAALWFGDRNLHGLLVFLSAWDIWHVLMQHYGFMRIYDAKQGAIRPLTSRLDWAVSLSWYLTLIVVSPHYLHNLLSVGYLSGFPLFSPEALALAKTGMLVLSGGLSFIYLLHHLQLYWHGDPVSFKKLMTLTIFLGATYYLYVYLGDFLVGFTVWSAFHCVQYYGIVWAFNRSRVERTKAVTAFIRFLFRPRAVLALLYVIIIFIYGSINYWTGLIGDPAVSRWILAFILTSTALHYYYDGFIWKVREADTRRHLNIESATGEFRLKTAGTWLAELAARLRTTPGLLQLGYLTAFGLALVVMESRFSAEPLEVSRSLVQASPEVGEAHFKLAETLESQGALDEAVDAYLKAAKLMPDAWEPRNNLGGLYFRQGRYREAIEQYRKAMPLLERDLELGGTLPAAFQHTNLSHRSQNLGADAVFVNLGDALLALGNREEALENFKAALEINPRSVRALTNIGTTLAETGNLQDGLSYLLRAVEIDDNYAYAHFNLGVMYDSMGDRDRALRHLHRAAETGDDSQSNNARRVINQIMSRRLR